MDEWIRHITHYLLWMEASNASPGTIKLRRSYLTRLARASNVGPWDTQPRDLLMFVTKCGKSAEARRSARTSVHHFYRWAYAEGTINDNPAKNLPTVKVPRGRPRPTPDAVLVAALAKAGRRERLMLLLGARAGLRRAEIAQVRGSDLGDDNILRVVGKGGDVRDIPILNGELLAALETAGDDYLFPGGHDGHIGPDWVGKILARELGPGWTGHTLRHRCGSRAFRGTKDIRSTQELLGHASPATTARYVLVTIDDLIDAVKAAA